MLTAAPICEAKGCLVAPSKRVTMYWGRVPSTIWVCTAHARDLEESGATKPPPALVRVREVPPAIPFPPPGSPPSADGSPVVADEDTVNNRPKAGLTLCLKNSDEMVTGMCRIAGCADPVKARGLCSAHREQADNAGRLDELGAPKQAPGRPRRTSPAATAEHLAEQLPDPAPAAPPPPPAADAVSEAHTPDVVSTPWPVADDGPDLPAYSRCTIAPLILDGGSDDSASASDVVEDALRAKLADLLGLGPDSEWATITDRLRTLVIVSMGAMEELDELTSTDRAAATRQDPYTWNSVVSGVSLHVLGLRTLVAGLQGALADLGVDARVSTTTLQAETTRLGRLLKTCLPAPLNQELAGAGLEDRLLRITAELARIPGLVDEVQAKGLDVELAKETLRAAGAEGPPEALVSDLVRDLLTHVPLPEAELRRRVALLDEADRLTAQAAELRRAAAGRAA